MHPSEFYKIFQTETEIFYYQTKDFEADILSLKHVIKCNINDVEYCERVEWPRLWIPALYHSNLL